MRLMVNTYAPRIRARVSLGMNADTLLECDPSPQRTVPFTSCPFHLVPWWLRLPPSMTSTRRSVLCASAHPPPPRALDVGSTHNTTRADLRGAILHLPLRCQVALVPDQKPIDALARVAVDLM